MAQLDKIIKVMLDRVGSDIVLSTGAEPYLRVEGGQPHVLISKKLTAQHLKQLVGELIGDAAMMQLESTDSGEHPYAFSGRVVTVVVRNWNGSVEARIRPGGKKAGGVATQTMPKGDVPKTQTQPKVELPKTQ